MRRSESTESDAHTNDVTKLTMDQERSKECHGVGEDWSLPEVELVPCIAVVEITHLPFLSALPACTFSRSTTLGSSHPAAAVHTLAARVRGGNVLLLSLIHI